MKRAHHELTVKRTRTLFRLLNWAEALERLIPFETDPMSELLRRAHHYKQRAKECEQLAEWSASAKVMQQCLTAARRYLSLAKAEERVARGLAELDDTSRQPRVTPVYSSPLRPLA